MNHTKEPWLKRGTVIASSPAQTYVAQCGHIEETMYMQPDKETGAANAARIVACVNACAGINPEVVPTLLSLAKDAIDIIDELRGYVRHEPQTMAHFNIETAASGLQRELKTAIALAEKEV